MELLRYPVHLDHAQFESLKEKNDFARTVAYHSKDFTDDRIITF